MLRNMCMTPNTQNVSHFIIILAIDKRERLQIIKPDDRAKFHAATLV